MSMDTKKKKGKRRVKYWAIVITKYAGEGRFMDNRFYDTLKGAKNALKTQLWLWKGCLKIVPCTITYTITKHNKGKK